jgi:Tol biopolymer transport system component
MLRAIVVACVLLLVAAVSSCGDGAEPHERLVFNGGVCPIGGGPQCGVFVLDPDGSNLTKIADVLGFWLQWSPDGRRLATAVVKSGQDSGDLIVFDADGSDVRTVATGVERESADYRPFAWSPAGAEIAYEASPEHSSGGQAYNLSVVDVETGQVRELAGGVNARAPVWSPDGSRIAFEGLDPDDEVEERYGIRGVWSDIWVVDADGENLRRLAHREFHDSGAAWSPDGKSIAWSGMDIEPGGQASSPSLYVASVEGGDVRTLGSGTGPVWSPNGGRIAFVQARLAEGDGSYAQDLLLLDVESGERTTLASGLRDVSRPVWAPDGTRIAFLSAHEGGSRAAAQIYVVDVEGANMTRITDDDLVKLDLDWSRR